MYVCTYVRMYIQVSVPVCMYVCTNACTHECIYVCIMCICMYIKLLLGVHCGPVPVPSPVQEEGWWRGADTAAVKNRLMKSNGRRRRVNGKHPDVEGEGKGVGHQHGRKPRIPESVPIAWKVT